MQSTCALSHEGFTLLELLVSLTILAIVTALIFGSLRIGFHAWERGERDINRNQRLRAVSELLKSQISSVYAGKRLKSDEGKEFVLRGDSKSMVFPSLVPILYSSGGRPVKVSYKVMRDETTDTYALVLQESDLISTETDKVSGKENLDKDYIPVVDHAEKIFFEYLSSSQNNGDEKWVEEWNEEKKNDLPVAVKVCIAYKKDNKPWCFIARLQMNPQL